MKNKQKIIISSYDDIRNPAYGGGGAVALHELAKRLSSSYEITFISWNHSGKSREEIDGVKYSRIGFHFFHPKIAMLLFQILLPILALSKKYDVWIESFGPPFTTSFLPAFTKKPVIGVVHMLAAEDMRRKYGIDLRKIEKAGIRKYQYIITTSQSVQKKIKALSKTCHCQIISNGITPVSIINPKKKKQILFLGRIEVDQKGLDLLLKAFEQFSQKSKESYKLIIAGSGIKEETQKLQEMINTCPLKKRIILKGRVEGKEKEKLLKESICLTVPSRFETYSLVALEGLAHGVPVISFDIEGLRWASPDLVKKVTPFDTEELALALVEVIQNVKHRAQVSKKGVEYARKFSWDHIVDMYRDYLEKQVNYAQ